MFQRFFEKYIIFFPIICFPVSLYFGLSDIKWAASGWAHDLTGEWRVGRDQMSRDVSIPERVE